MNPIFESKTALRRKLADLPTGEKLTLLDAMRDRHPKRHPNLPSPSSLKTEH